MMDGADWFWGVLMMLLFWGGLAAVMAFGARAWSGRSDRGAGSLDARTILENRFARGEISREEFEERRKVLESAGA
jgi:putative membrane protein